MEMMNNVKHKVFISFYHHDDEKYKERIEYLFDDKIINKSVSDGEFDSNNKDEYIKRLIRENKITDSSIIIVLVGRNTKRRKHVDWEIYAGLRRSIYGSSALIGVILPEINTNNYMCYLPDRLKDNVKSGYAQCYDWSYFIRNFEDIIEKTYKDKNLLESKIDNSRIQMKENR